MQKFVIACAIVCVMAALDGATWGQAPRGQRSKGGEPPADTAATPLPRGLRPRAFALLNARVIVEPGQVLEKANVIIRDGIITEVGQNATIPGDASRIDLSGKTIVAGFIDAASYWGLDLGMRRPMGGPPAPDDLAAEPP